MASAKAGDQILAVRIPPAAEKLRRLMNLAQIIQSHALSFFHLSAPDLLLGMDSDPARRNVFGLIAAEPELARGGIRLRQFGQQIIAALGGQKSTPPGASPAACAPPLRIEDRDCDSRRASPSRAALSSTPSAASRDCWTSIGRRRRLFGNFPTLYLGLVAADGTWEHYDGKLRLVDGEGKIVADGIDPSRYREHFGEAAESWSYLKSPYYRPLRLSRRHLPRRPAGPPQPLHAHGHAAGRQGAGRVPPARRRRGQLRLLLPLRPADRDPRGHRAHRANGGRSRSAIGAFARRCGRESTGGRRLQRGAARHAVPPLSGERRRPAFKR